MQYNIIILYFNNNFKYIYYMYNRSILTLPVSFKASFMYISINKSYVQLFVNFTA